MVFVVTTLLNCSIAHLLNCSFARVAHPRAFRLTLAVVRHTKQESARASGHAGLHGAGGADRRARRHPRGLLGRPNGAEMTENEQNATGAGTRARSGRGEGQEKFEETELRNRIKDPRGTRLGILPRNIPSKYSQEERRAPNAPRRDGSIWRSRHRANSPVRSVSSPVRSVRSPVRSVRSPVRSVRSPVRSVRSPV
eukprot:7115767-Pyramimonas_sp.AAC.1